jgi:hypothetical protein
MIAIGIVRMRNPSSRGTLAQRALYPRRLGAASVGMVDGVVTVSVVMVSVARLSVLMVGGSF